MGASAHGVKIQTVDYHTAGEPFRIVTGGVEPLPGRTILDKRRFAAESLDDVRKLLVFEPRGHADMYGCFVTEPEDDGADLGTVFFHNAGYSTACGHGTIALATYAVDAGLVEVTEPETELTIDVPSGRLPVVVSVEGGRPVRARFRNVPAFVFAEGLGSQRADVAYGGAFYAFVRAELPVEPANVTEFIRLGREVKRELEVRARDRPSGRAGAARHLRGRVLAARGRRCVGTRPAKHHGVRRRRGRPLAVRQRDVGPAGASRREGRAGARGGPAAPERDRHRVRVARGRGVRRRCRDRGLGLGLPHRARTSSSSTRTTRSAPVSCSARADAGSRPCRPRP